MKPEDMDEVLRHTTPTVLRVREHVRPETKTLIDKANQLFAVWREQEKAWERAWEDNSTARKAFFAAVEGNTASAEEIRAAFQRWETLGAYADSVAAHFNARAEWETARVAALTALAVDAGLSVEEEGEPHEL